MAKTRSHAFIGGSRRTEARGGYRRKPKPSGDGPKFSEIIEASPELQAMIAECQRDKRKDKGDDGAEGVREAQQ
ncbi:hypothetical protein [Bifidobacterium longum]|uniref:hypothetical protein n=1 Tax=Bifidobacterium longum TaxID=216816 RepID=UPI001EE0E3FE|nr:hypothetical protein [Bifidobacterium longum]MBS7125696.1 hypothetical protein [Collinsella sp.]MCG4852795.1 hypothetical protein [Bifidobacterium longum]